MESLESRFKSLESKCKQLYQDQEDLYNFVEQVESLINQDYNKPHFKDFMNNTDSVEVNDHSKLFFEEYCNDSGDIFIKFVIHRELEDGKQQWNEYTIDDIRWSYLQFSQFKKHHVETLVKQVLDQIEKA